jgi:hypothetical protein
MRVWVGLALVLLAGQVRAQDLEPRSYTNVPVGLNFLVAGYAHAEGSVSTDASLPLEDAELEQTSLLMAYSHVFALLGRVAKADLIVPYSFLEGSALLVDPVLGDQRVERDVAGYGDPRVRFTWNFIGAPALTLEQWQRRPDDLVVGASVQVGIPAGRYDDDRIVNLGANRFSVKPELGISKSWGRASLELAAAATFYEDNRDFVGMTREQDPLYAFQGHLIWAFRRPVWLAVDGTYYRGGDTRVGRRKKDDLQRNTRAGITLAFPLGVHHSAKLYASWGVSERIGGDFDVLGFAWQYRWGAGL